MGATFELAAKYAGITYASFNNYRKRGEAELERRKGGAKSGTAQWRKEQPFVEFFLATQKAEADAAVKWLAKIEQAAATHWQAAAWKLERRYPNQYGRTRVDHDITSGGNTIIIHYADDDGENYT